MCLDPSNYPKDYSRWCFIGGFGSKNFRVPGESVTITRKEIGEPLNSRHLSAVIAAGAGDDLPWSDFVAHAVGLQLLKDADDILFVTQNDDFSNKYSSKFDGISHKC